MHDRFTRTLLVLIAVALWGLLLRSQPAPQPVATRSAPSWAQRPITAPLAAEGPQPRFLTISNGKVSIWKVRLSDNGKDELKLQDSKSLP